MVSNDMKVSKGLEFPVVALPGVSHMPAPGEVEKEAARVFYVAATRAKQRLVIGVGEDGCQVCRAQEFWCFRCRMKLDNYYFYSKLLRKHGGNRTKLLGNMVPWQRTIKVPY
jgi:hypothetical protein